MWGYLTTDLGTLLIMSLGLLTVLFYRRLSDSWGRKFVIGLQITGRLLALTWIVLVGECHSHMMLSEATAHSDARFLLQQRGP